MEKFLNFQLDPSEAELDFSHHLTRVFNDGEPDRYCHVTVPGNVEINNGLLTDVFISLMVFFPAMRPEDGCKLS